MIIFYMFGVLVASCLFTIYFNLDPSFKNLDNNETLLLYTMIYSTVWPISLIVLLLIILPFTCINFILK